MTEATQSSESQSSENPERGTAPLSIRLRLGSTARIGPGKVALLESIASCGELSEAARVMGMSARRAWLLIDSLNQVFDQALVTRESENDRLRLTPLGEELIRAYRTVEQVTEAAVAQQFAGINGRLVKSTAT